MSTAMKYLEASYWGKRNKRTCIVVNNASESAGYANITPVDLRDATSVVLFADVMKGSPSPALDAMQNAEVVVFHDQAEIQVDILSNMMTKQPEDLFNFKSGII